MNNMKKVKGLTQGISNNPFYFQFLKTPIAKHSESLELVNLE